MSVQTVTLGADITALKRAMAGARLAGFGKDGAAALSKEISGEFRGRDPNV